MILTLTSSLLFHIIPFPKPNKHYIYQKTQKKKQKKTKQNKNIVSYHRVHIKFLDFPHPIPLYSLYFSVSLVIIKQNIYKHISIYIITTSSSYSVVKLKHAVQGGSFLAGPAGQPPNDGRTNHYSVNNQIDVTYFTSTPS
jgi:hypothetical protein